MPERSPQTSLRLAATALALLLQTAPVLMVALPALFSGRLGLRSHSVDVLAILSVVLGLGGPASVALPGARGLLRMPAITIGTAIHFFFLLVGLGMLVSPMFYVGGGLVLSSVLALWALLASPPTERTPDNRCPRCGYDLHGLSGPICPECGWTEADAPG